MLNNEMIKLKFSGNRNGVFISSFFFELGMALSLVFTPLWALELGASLTMVGWIAGAGGLGRILADLPAGWLAGKIREKVFLSVALTGLVLTAFFTGLAQEPWQLLLTILLQGVFRSFWQIGRLAYVKKSVNPNIRGKTLSFLGGIMRVSRIFSPAMGGIIIKVLGFPVLFFTQSFFLAIALLLSLLLVHTAPPLQDNPSFAAPSNILKNHLRKEGKNIAIAILGISGLMLLRRSRSLLFPIWAEHIGVSVATIGIITSAGAIIETLMVIPAGQILDKKGRKWTAVPCILGMSLAMALLPLTQRLSTLVAVYFLLALANGLGSGINMTISSDLAPRNAEAEFLGIWRFFTDGSFMIGPVLTGYIAAIFGLSAAPLVMALAGMSTGILVLLKMKETAGQN